MKKVLIKMLRAIQLCVMIILCFASVASILSIFVAMSMYDRDMVVSKTAAVDHTPAAFCFAFAVCYVTICYYKNLYWNGKD